MDDLVEVYLSERCRAGYFKPDTARVVSGFLRRFAREAGIASPRQVRRVDLETWLAGRRVAAGTARNQFSRLQSFFNWLVATERIDRHPMTGMAPPRAPRTVPRGLPGEAIAHLLSTLDTRGKLVISLMVQEGLRTAEVCGLQIADIDFTPGVESVFVTGKGGHQRMLPVSAETLGYMRCYLGEHPAKAGSLIRTLNAGGPPGRGLRPNYLSHLVARWMYAAGIKQAAYDGVSAHAGRHTCATDLVRAGVHIRDVQAVLGHASLITTQRYIGRANPDELRSAMAGRRYGKN